MNIKSSIRRMLTRTRSHHSQKQPEAASTETVAESADPSQTKPPSPPSSTPRQGISKKPSLQLAGFAQEESVETPANQITDQQSRQSSTDDSRPASRSIHDSPEDKPILVLQQATPTSEDGSSLQYLDAVNETAVVT